MVISVPVMIELGGRAAQQAGGLLVQIPSPSLEQADSLGGCYLV